MMFGSKVVVTLSYSSARYERHVQPRQVPSIFSATLAASSEFIHGRDSYVGHQSDRCCSGSTSLLPILQLHRQQFELAKYLHSA